MPGDRRVHAAFGHLDAVQLEARDVGAGKRVRAHPIHVCRTRVIAEENDAVESIVDPAHHAEFTRRGPNDGDIVRQSFDQEVLTVAVGVGDDELRRPGLAGRIDCRVDFSRHESAKSLVLEATRPQLLSGDRANHAFHVGGDEYLQAIVSGPMHSLTGPARSTRVCGCSWCLLSPGRQKDLKDRRYYRDVAASGAKKDMNAMARARTGLRCVRSAGLAGHRPHLGRGHREGPRHGHRRIRTDARRDRGRWSHRPLHGLLPQEAGCGSRSHRIVDAGQWLLARKCRLGVSVEINAAGRSRSHFEVSQVDASPRQPAAYQALRLADAGRHG